MYGFVSVGFMRMNPSAKIRTWDLPGSAYLQIDGLSGFMVFPEGISTLDYYLQPDALTTELQRVLKAKTET